MSWKYRSFNYLRRLVTISSCKLGFWDISIRSNYIYKCNSLQVIVSWFAWKKKTRDEIIFMHKHINIICRNFTCTIWDILVYMCLCVSLLETGSYYKALLIVLFFIWKIMKQCHRGIYKTDGTQWFYFPNILNVIHVAHKQ